MIGIYVFSGTGNTYKCAEQVKERLLAAGAEVSLRRIENGKERVEEGFDTLLIGYPVHGFNMPYNVMDFNKQLVQNER